MSKLNKAIGKLARRVVERAMGNDLSQAEIARTGEGYSAPGMGELIRQAGAEGCVLLKNDGALPLPPEKPVAVFGRCQIDWFYVGYGSGGDVKAPYYVNLIDGLDNAGIPVYAPLREACQTWRGRRENLPDPGWWGHWPRSHPEMSLEPELVRRAAAECETALVVIGRTAGESMDNIPEPGGYYLTDQEREMLKQVTAAFDRVVAVLNIGNIIDFSWTEEYDLSAVLIVWQGGMERGNAAADVLSGKVNPCGRMADCIARRYEDYPGSANFGGKEYNEYAEGIFVGYRHFLTKAPDRLLFPFGFGLSYTRFSVEPEPLRYENGQISVDVRITNVGGRPGKEVLQLFCAAPEGRLEKPAQVLAAFGKTKLLQPGESETVLLSCGERCFCSYDESLHAFVLEAGDYRFTVNGTDAGTVTVPEEQIVEQCNKICLPGDELRQRILEHLPDEIPPKHGDHTLNQAAAGEIKLDDLIAELTDEELEAMTRGEGMMNSPHGPKGNAGAFGGCLERLRRRGFAPLITADGPAGLRLSGLCSLLPCATALACTWDTALMEGLYRKVGEEMSRAGVDVHLGPGLNIHRDPLCGRNFEYFSEDPLLSGKLAAAAVRGVQSAGHAGCPKHFACNNQEYRRNTNDSRLSERALREIYLRGFEICVREGRPKTLMTSYNKINGVWGHYHYDLVTTVLRGEWGFGGVVLTDWWMKKARSPEFPKLRDNAYRVRAGVDVLMPGDMGHTAKRYRSDGTLLKTLGQPGGITRAELQRTAGSVLKLILDLKY